MSYISDTHGEVGFERILPGSRRDADDEYDRWRDREAAKQFKHRRELTASEIEQREARASESFNLIH